MCLEPKGGIGVNDLGRLETNAHGKSCAARAVAHMSILNVQVNRQRNVQGHRAA